MPPTGRALLLTALSILLAAPLAAQGVPLAKAGPLEPDLARIQTAYQAHVRSRATTPFHAVTAHGVRVGRTVPVEASATDGDGAALLAQLQALGLEGGVAVGMLVDGRLPLDALGAAAALPRLRAARIPLALSFGAGVTRRARRPGSPVLNSVTGEASRALRADLARAAHGVDGTGLVIGVLSDSFDHCGPRNADADPDNNCTTAAAADIASGDLPAGGVTVVEELGGTEASDEGRAMIQLARDVAPGAGFAFHTAFAGQASFAQGIVDLADAGADVIVDDVLNFGEPFFQDGVVAQAVEAVVARGIPYFSSAGNQADQSYEATFVDSGLDAAFVVGGGTLTGDLHDFDPSGAVDAFQSTTLAPGDRVQLAFQFDEPSFSASGGAAGATSDYDILILATEDPTAAPLASSTANNPGNGEPVEVVSYTNETGAAQTVHLAIVKFSGAARFMKYVEFVGAAAFQFAQSGKSTSVAHNNAVGAMGVAAAPWFNTPAFNAGLTEAAAESFTSFGGGQIRFDGAGNRLGSPVDRRKPDVMGSDGDNNTFFGQQLGDGDTNPNFFGTSAAAPNVAAVAALMIEAAGGVGAITPARIYELLETTADDVLNAQGNNPNTGPGYDVRTGEGFVRADLAVAAARASVAVGDGPAAGVTLSPPLPNPTSGDFAATLAAAAPQAVRAELFDVLGRRVALLHDGPVGAAQILRLDGGALAPGLYVLRASGADWSLSRTVSIAR